MAFMMTRRKGKDGSTEEFSPEETKERDFFLFLPNRREVVGLVICSSWQTKKGRSKELGEWGVL